VIQRWARLRPSGKPVLCSPSPRSSDRRSENKVIYDSIEAARSAASELRKLGSLEMEPYTCHRSTRRHHQHLRTRGYAIHDRHARMNAHSNDKRF
jgi:hypothetical protein